MTNERDAEWLEGPDLLSEDSPGRESVRAALIRAGHVDDTPPAEQFLNRVEATAVGISGKILGVSVKGAEEGGRPVIIPESVLNAAGKLISWLETNGFGEVAREVHEDQEHTFASELRDRAAYATVTLHERDGLKVMPDGSLCASFGAHVFNGAGDTQLTVSNRQHQKRGTLTGWTEISPFALENPMLMVSLGVAFSPAFAWWTRRHIGFEILGRFGADDERVIVQVANSVHGSPDQPVSLTDLRAGLEALSSVGRVGLLAVDELVPEELLQLAQLCSADKHVLGLVTEVPEIPAVLVVGGSWKSPTHRLQQPKWRPAHEQALPGLPAAFSGNILSDDEGKRATIRQQIRQVVGQHFGHAYPELLRALVDLQAEAPRLFEAHRLAAEKKLHEDAGVVVGIEGYVLNTFAMVSAVIGMVAHVGILEVSEDAGLQCSSVIFRRWQAAWRCRRGVGNAVLATAVQSSLRAANATLCDESQPDVERHKLGHRAAHGGEMVLWFTTEEFAQLCGDFDPRACAEALDYYGALLKQNKGYQFRKRVHVPASADKHKSRAGDLQSFYAVRASFLELVVT